ncbi:hypothetical protein ABPG75_002781 [Micractinium tetrahymenae]
MSQTIANPPACSGCCWHRAGAAAAAGSHQQRPPRAMHRPCRQLNAVRTAAAADAAAADAAAWAGGSGSGLAAAKQRLLAALAGTERGAEARSLQRGEVEEAQVAVEAFSSGAELDFSLLEGCWRLEYTTASDVLPLVAPARGPLSPLLQIGRIYQAFSGAEGSGTVRNIIEARLPPLLPLLPRELEAEVTLVVEAGWEARTARSIALTFREAGFQDVTLSPALQNLLASPILPRGWWNQQLLLAIKQLSLRVPLTTRVPGASSSQQAPVGLNYMLTHLDEDMLIGRAQGNGGVFIFTREFEEEAAAKEEQH